MSEHELTRDIGGSYCVYAPAWVACRQLFYASLACTSSNIIHTQYFGWLVHLVRVQPHGFHELTKLFTQVLAK